MTQRNAVGRPPKLTKSLIEELCTAVRTMAHLEFACDFVDIDGSTLRKWRQRATAAEAKKSNMRSPHERLCIELFTQLRHATAQGYMTAWLSVLEQGTKPQVTRTVTRTKYAGSDDETVTVVEVTKPPDYRAALALWDRRWRDLARSEEPERLDEVATPTLDETIGLLNQIRAEREGAGLRLVQGGDV